MTARLPRARGRPRNAAPEALSRESILDRALTAFAENGYAGMSMRDLCRRLEVSHGLLRIRFGSKLDLWKAAVHHGLDHLTQAFPAIPVDIPVQDQFRQAVVSALLGMHAVPAMLQLVNHEGAVESDRLDYLTNALFSARYGRLEGIVELGIAQGRFRRVSPHLLTALAGHGGGVAFSLAPLARRLRLMSGTADEELRQRADEIAEFLLRGLSVVAPDLPVGR